MRQGGSTAQPKPIDRTGLSFIYFLHQVMSCLQICCQGTKNGDRGASLSSATGDESKADYLQEQLTC